METKVCTKCKQTLSTDFFHPRKNRKSGYHSACKKCAAEVCKRYYREHNPNKRLSTREAKSKVCCSCKQDLDRENFYKMKKGLRKGLLSSRCISCSNTEFENLKQKFSSEEGKSIRAEHRRTRWTKLDPALAKAKVAKRTAKLLEAFPKWADETKIKEIYKQASEFDHVDHIIPLQSKYVSGLHVESNLRVIPAKENLSENNRYWPDMPVIDAELKQLAERFYNDF